MFFTHLNQGFGIVLVIILAACSTNEKAANLDEWKRDANNPIYRDYYENENYQSASDGHVFYTEDGSLYMIYSGDKDGVSSIKLAKAKSWHEWESMGTLLSLPNETQSDISKETAFYRKSQDGKHQIYYIGYVDGSTYESQVFLAESDNLEGPYIQYPEPIVSKGDIAGKSVYLITSPSVVEHNAQLYMSFIGWNDSPNKVTEVWSLGATSTDGGRSWSNFQLVDTPITMEGQITKTPDGGFVAVRTGEYNDTEAIFYAESDHPFGPWTTNEEPIIIKDGSTLERDEVIAPQITFDKDTDEPILFYTGADYSKGWWMMLARKN